MSSCKEKYGPNPTIKFFETSGHTFKNDSLAPNDSVKIGVNCKWNGVDLLKSLKIYNNNDLIYTFNPPETEVFGYDYWFKKTNVYKDSISFEVVDVKGQNATISLIFTIDSTKITR